MQQTSSEAYLLSVQLQQKRSIPCLSHANICLPIVEEIHTD